jgi:signal transduction histidine kinase
MVRFAMRRALFVVLFVLLPLLAVRALDPWPVQELRGRLFDWMQSVQPRVPGDRPVLIVDIDEESIAAMGQWPWPRSRMAQLVEAVAAGEPKAIGFDILFAEADRMSPDRVAGALQDVPDELKERLAKVKPNDVILAESFDGVPVVLGVAVAYGVDHGGGQVRSGLTPVIEIGADPRPFLPAYNRATANIAVLTEAAAGQGTVSFDLGSGGVARRYSGLVAVRGNLVPSMALEMVRVGAGQRQIAVHAGVAGIEGYESGDRYVPADDQGHLWPYFSRHDDARFVSAHALMNGRADLSSFADAYVLIGTTASGLVDIYQTPVGTTMAGVEIQAQLIETILQGTLLVRPAFAVTIELVLILVAGLVIVLTQLTMRPRPGVVVFVVVVAVLAGIAWVAFDRMGVLVDGLMPALSAFVIFAAMMTAGLIAEERARRERDARLRVLQDELNHVGRLSSLGQLSSAIAHEVNQPLAAIVNYLQAARRLHAGDGATPDGGKIEGMLDKAVTQAERAAAIIRGLRTMVEEGDVERREEDINDLIDEAMALATIGGKQRGIVVRTHYAPGLPLVSVNRIQIQQVVVNLVRNAIDAMADSQSRVLTVDTGAGKGGMVEVAVGDTGPGIAADMEDRLFQPFVSGKSQGMGIGLSICRSIIEAHGGTIWIEGNSARGVTIRFSVPAGRQEGEGHDG